MANGVTALGFTLIVLLGVLAIPAAINATDNTQTETQQIDIGETGFFNNQLTVAVIDASNSEATLRIIDEETEEREDITLANGATTNVTFEPGTIQVTNDLSNNQGSTITVIYDANYGFNPGAKQVGDNLGVILVTMLFVAIMAFVGIRP